MLLRFFYFYSVLLIYLDIGGGYSPYYYYVSEDLFERLLGDKGDRIVSSRYFLFL